MSKLFGHGAAVLAVALSLCASPFVATSVVAQASVVGYGDTAAVTFTRPADTTAYASGDIVCQSTTVSASGCAPLTFAVSRQADKSFLIPRARISASNTTLTNASFRLHLYRQSPTIANGDNGAWSTTNSNYMGSMDVTFDRQFTDGAKGIAVPSSGSYIVGVPDSGTTAIYGLLEARAAYAPTNAQTFTILLEILQN
ncbi:hypothetical protein I3J27_21505 [Bradyrhizobium xenonodulans]|uniref:Spore coat protein U domain-containing protein n=1 Tax=Bradyrhizobium xenonodulans TaxID=2736875 RepID=A0ABY7ME31_9BRAD|nr:hypothetical protein [Bradyrhizobium xenonodulans]WBL75612.1 hypothetical protein I3J27_21505 [Bradyrhizobium xenonodulans]